ncbi:MAG: response regulator [Rhodospirillales bacterium]|nr:response regulator [Rhodospirillales bacterium]
MNILVPARAVILLAEDNLADQRLIERALHIVSIEVDLHIVADGEDAIRYLRNEGAYSDQKIHPRPNLVLLDMNMPRMNGKEALRAIQSDSDLRTIPVVMLTTSLQKTDIAESYALGVNAYIAKPADIEKFYLAIKRLDEFWFDLVCLPGKVSRTTEIA